MRDIVIAGARPWGGEVCDILVRDGQIAARGKAIDAAPEGAEQQCLTYCQSIQAPAESRGPCQQATVTSLCEAKGGGTSRTRRL